MCLGLPLGAPVDGVAGAAVINPNLLTKTEQFDAAAWVKSGVTVNANVATDPLGGATADNVAFSSASGSLMETTTLAAASGGITGNRVPLAPWTRFSVTAVLDVGTYTYSLWMRDPGVNGYIVRMELSVVGGFVCAKFRDVGDLANFYAWGAKLEIGPTATGTAADYGMVA